MKATPPQLPEVKRLQDGSVLVGNTQYIDGNGYMAQSAVDAVWEAMAPRDCRLRPMCINTSVPDSPTVAPLSCPLAKGATLEHYLYAAAHYQVTPPIIYDQ